MATPTQLLSEVIQVLCGGRALWPSGNCVPTTETGQTDVNLLTMLIASFPGTLWDMPTLTTILAMGRKCGALLAWPNPTTGQTLYFVRLEMARLNPTNEVFRSDCPQIYEPRPAERRNVTVA